jgi:hypothetical protein
MNPLVFIVILNWNRKEDTLECLSSLKKIDYKNYKTVIVDNGSRDDSVKEIKKEFPHTYILKKKINIGFAGGCNVGIRYALKNKTDYVLLLNNDTVVDKRFLSEMMKAAESDEKIGIVCPKVYFYSKPKLLQYAGLKFDFNKGESVLIGYDKLDKGQFDKIQEADFCGGTCMLVKKEVFEKAGFFDKMYFLYFEDNDFGFRARKSGYKIIFCPKAKIWHKISASTGGQTNPTKEYYLARNNLIFMKKYSKKSLLINFIPHYLINAALCSLSFIWNGRLDLFNARIKGVYDGLKWKGA